MRRWVAKSLSLSKGGASGGTLRIRCPPLERARNRLVQHRAATHIIRFARGFMSKCRVKRIVALMQEQARQQKQMRARLEALRASRAASRKLEDADEDVDDEALIT